MSLNPSLIKFAKQALQKKAIQLPGQDPNQPPPGQDPAAGGGMPPPGMDPSQMGGMPPPGMDPAAMGGMPPPGADPMAGGMPPPGADPMAAGGAPPTDPSSGLTADSIRQIMTEVMGQLGATPGQAGPGGGAAGGKPGKPDLLAMSMDIFQIKKMLSALMNSMDIPLPQDVIDGANRDPNTGVPMAPNTPGSTSDPNRQSPPASGASGKGPNSAIKPVDPIQGAFPGASGGGMGGSPTPQEKMSNQKIGEQISRKDAVRKEASALGKLLRRKMKV